MAVALDSCTTISTTFGTSGGTIGSFHTVTGANTFLAVDVMWLSAYTVTGVTYNGVSLSSFGKPLSQNNGGAAFLQSWYLVNPATGKNSLQVSYSTGASTRGVGVGIRSFTGVDQATPYSSYVTQMSSDAAAPFRVTKVITSAVGELVVGAVTASGSNNTVEPDSGQTEQFDMATNANGNMQIGGSYTDGAASVTMGWTSGLQASTNYAATAYSLTPAAAATTGSPFYYINRRKHGHIR